MLRRWGRVAALLLTLLVCLLPHLVCRALGRPSPWPRRFLALCARAIGMRVEICGAPLTRDVFFIANHVSWIDILALGGASGCAFVSRDDVARWPLVGWLAAQNNTIFVARDRRGAVGGQIATLRQAVARHQPVALFPEGTTGDGRTLLPFKPALFAVLMPPPRDMRIQPVWIDYGARTGPIAWYGEESAGANMTRVLNLPGRSVVRLHFLAPIDPGDHPDRKAIAAQCAAAILRAQGTLPDPPAPV